MNAIATEGRSMKMLLVGAVGVLALQVVLVGAYLAVDSQDPILLNPESGSLEDDGLTMVMLCGEGLTPEGRGSEVLSKMPPDGDIGAWSRGRALRGDSCDIWYHHNVFYNPHAYEECSVGCDHDWLERRLR
jgi:hypothetical protein